MTIRLSRYQKKLVMMRDGYTCRKCGVKLLSDEERSRIPHVHHIDRNQGNNSDENLIAYCSHCHSSVKKERARKSNVTSFLPSLFDEEFVSTVKAAEVLSVHRKTLLAWIKKGYIESWSTPGGHYKIHAKELDRLWRLLSGQDSRRPLSGQNSPQPIKS